MAKIQGYFKITIYENNGFMICKFLLKENIRRFILVKGNLGNIEREQLYELDGDFVEDHKYGKQFIIKSYQPIIGQDNESLIKYFASPMFPGVGINTATKIIDYLQTDVLNKIINNSQILFEIGIKSSQAKIIYQKINEQKVDSELTKCFIEAKLSLNLLQQLKIKCGDNLLSLIKSNPFVLSDYHEGLTFNKADQLGKVLGVKLNDTNRLEAALKFVIKEETFKTGNSYVSAARVFQELQKYSSLDEQLITNVSKQAVINKKVAIVGSNFYDYEVYHSEINIAKFLKNLQKNCKIDHLKLAADINKIETENKIIYDDAQKLSLIKFLENNLLIINGGPGTGKTTLIQGVISLFKKYFPNQKIALCAPTGRAAKRLKDQTNIDAMTIHKLLKWDINNNKFNHCAAEPLDIDLIIIDEMSMVDTVLFNSLLDASPNLKKLVLVGDNNQLPSINSGNILEDLLLSLPENVVSLQRVYRQQKDSEIINLAYQIQQAQFDYHFKNTNEVFFLEENQVVKLLKQLAVLFVKLVNMSNIFDVQVLAPIYNQQCGINVLNEVLQAAYNPAAPHKKELKLSLYVFRIGDKVMQVKNNSEKDVYNGDLGIITDISLQKDQQFIDVQFDQRILRYNGSQWHELILAYAISVHKSQGSEYPFVILIVHQSAGFMLKRNLIYTAITRCRKQLYILGEKTVFINGINYLTPLRLTTLKSYLV